MSSFDVAIVVVLDHEGGYANESGDSGGPTNFGISEKFLCDEAGLLPSDADTEIKTMTKEQAAALYHKCWWDRYGYGALRNQQLATKIFDMAVNMGAEQAHKLLQRSANELGMKLEVDGVLGPETLRAANACIPDMLINKLVSKQAAFYQQLAIDHPKMRKFLTGWLERAAWPLTSAKEKEV